MAAREFDSIVIGLGGMGAAACFHLARRGQRVLGLEQFDIPHDLGGSHGSSRVIRLAYFEDPRYVPLVRRAYQLWHELEIVANERLIVSTGGIDLGRADCEAMIGVQAALREHQIPFELLDGDAVRRRFPAFQPPADHVGIFQSEAGFVIPERCTIAHLEAAMRQGARCQARERVTAWNTANGRVIVTTDRGSYESRRLIVTAGAWLPELLRDLAIPIHVERQVMAWFCPERPDDFEVGRMPVFIHHLTSHDCRTLGLASRADSPAAAFYGVPHHGRPGVKVCRHHGGALTTPSAIDRTPRQADEDELRAYLARCMPGANGPLMAVKVCMYDNTPDQHFIVDRHPRHAEVIVAGGFSGHGYKFASVIGEIAADLALDGRTAHPIGCFQIGRLLRR